MINSSKFTASPFSLAAFAVLLLFGLGSCNKQTLEEPTATPSDVNLDSPFLNRVVDITYHYDYYGETFTVVSTVDRETQEVLAKKGDVERAKALLGQEDNVPQGYVYNVTHLAEDAVNTVLVFDTQEEADLLMGFGGENTSQHCQYFESFGTATYRFYEHANYVGELSDLTKSLKGWLGWNYVMNHNNDKISSFWVHGNPSGSSCSKCLTGVLGLYMDICYGGPNVYYATESQDLRVPDLESHYVGGPATFWFKEEGSPLYFNDGTSATRGQWKF